MLRSLLDLDRSRLSIFRCHDIFMLFSGESYDGPTDWSSMGVIDLLLTAPDPYGFCFDKGFTWTCETMHDPKTDSQKNSIEDTSVLKCCRLNGKPQLQLNRDFGEKMQPLESKTVFIDVKFVSTLHALASCKILENLEKHPHSQHSLESPLPLVLNKHLTNDLHWRSKSKLKNY